MTQIPRRYYRDVYPKGYPGAIKYYQNKPSRVGEKVLTVDEYNVQAQKLEDAINRSVTQSEPLEQSEQRGKLFHLGGLTAPARTRPPGELRRTDKAGNYRLRISIGSKKTLARLLTTGAWTVEASTQEGQDGAIFYTPIDNSDTADRIPVPVLGLCIDLGGDWEQIQVFNRTNVADVYDISAAVIEGRAQEGTLPRETDSGVNARLHSFTHHFGFSVPGGVQVGDTVQQRDYKDGLLTTYPAREGGVYGVNLATAFVRYVPAGAAVTNILWTCYRRV